MACAVDVSQNAPAASATSGNADVKKHNFSEVRSSLTMQDEATYQFPMLRHEGLKGAIVYYDGQHNDTRMNVLIGLTAAQKGAVVANYVEVKELLKDSDLDKNGASRDKLVGARLRDNLTGEEWEVRAKVIINATGPFADGIRQMDDPAAPKAIVPAAGVHTIIPDHFSPDKYVTVCTSI